MTPHRRLLFCTALLAVTGLVSPLAAETTVPAPAATAASPGDLGKQLEELRATVAKLEAQVKSHDARIRGLQVENRTLREGVQAALNAVGETVGEINRDLKLLKAAQPKTSPDAAAAPAPSGK